MAPIHRSRVVRVALIACLAGLAGGGSAVMAQSAAGWTGELTVRVEARGNRDGRAGEQRRPDQPVSEQARWRIDQELKATLAFTQKVRGAVASGMPDANNEARYESWLSRPRQGRQSATLRIDAESVSESAVRLILVDGEGAAEINRQRAGRIGRIEHQRQRLALAGDGADAGELEGGGFVQIDRGAGRLHLELPAMVPVAGRVKATQSRVMTMDKAPPPDTWDQQQDLAADKVRTLFFNRLPLLVFEIPTDAESFEVAQTVALTLPVAGQAHVSLRLRRTDAAVHAVAPGAPAPAAAPARAKPDCARPASDAATAGAEVGGKVLGGGHGRQVGAAIGGLFGALGGGTKRADLPPDSPPGDCAR